MHLEEFERVNISAGRQMQIALEPVHHMETAIARSPCRGFEPMDMRMLLTVPGPRYLHLFTCESN